jgi:hypothetical protein
MAGIWPCNYASPGDGLRLGSPSNGWPGEGHTPRDAIVIARPRPGNPAISRPKPCRPRRPPLPPVAAAAATASELHRIISTRRPAAARATQFGQKRSRHVRHCRRTAGILHATVASCAVPPHVSRRTVPHPCATPRNRGGTAASRDLPALPAQRPPRSPAPVFCSRFPAAAFATVAAAVAAATLLSHLRALPAGGNSHEHQNM